MSENKTPIVWKWGVVLLVLCNIGLMLTIWLSPHRPFRQRPESPHDFVVRNLKFNAEQVKKYDELVNIHRQSMDRLEKDGNNYRQLLFSDLGSTQKVNADSLAQLIADNQKQIELATRRHFTDVRAMCTDEQKVIFDKIISDVLKRMHGGAPRQQPGEQGPPPGDGPPPPGDRPGPPEGR